MTLHLRSSTTILNLNPNELKFSNPKLYIIHYFKKYYLEFSKSPTCNNTDYFPFNKKFVYNHFQTWSNALKEAKLPLNRNKSKLLNCAKCKIEFEKQHKEIKKSKKHFCGNACSASYYTAGRKHSEETKKKISESLKAHKIF